MSLPQSLVLQIITPLLTDIRFSFYHAWSEYMTQYTETRHNHCPTTRANVIHDHIKKNVREKFKNRNGARVIEGPNMPFTLVIKESLYIQFHKLDEKNLPSNPITQRRLNFIEQDVFGLGDTQNLFAGYKLNELETAIGSVLITAPRGMRNEWYIPLGEDLGEVINFPSKPKEVTKQKRVRIKKIEKQGEERNG
jgi:hypothetical protein